MTFTFVSNYINHHQKPFCDAMYSLMGKDFTFVQTMPMEQERIDMGWNTELTQLEYVKLLYEDDTAEQLIMDSDCVLFGWSEREDIASKRLKSGKMTLRVSERLYRDGVYKAISPRGLYAKYHEHIKYRNKPVYMLCAGAYTAYDFNLIHAYPEKKLKWGYFPPLRIYEEGELEEKKSIFSEKYEGLQIVWAGRFIPLKHPEFMIELAKQLNEKNYKFHIHMIGSGEMERSLLDSISDNHLENDFSMYGFLSPDEVRDVMEKCHIHICTSNQLEGWGAVVNEGMNSGCVEIISNRMGAAPFLISEKINGLTYKNDNCLELIEKVIETFDRWDEYKLMGTRAYHTIRDEWNAETAAKRLYEFVNGLEEEKEILPKDGPLSKASVLKL